MLAFRSIVLGSLVVSATYLSGCDGKILAPPARGGGIGGVVDDIPPDTNLGANLAARAALRRLTQAEYDEAVRVLLGDDTHPSSTFLPGDTRNPFDNDVDAQVTSQALIEGAEQLADDVTARALSDVKKRDLIVGCKPTAANDTGCFKKFVESFGRRAFRRPLTSDELTRYSSVQSLAVEAKDFYVGVATVLRGMLQDPNFLYRVEIGTPVDGDATLRKLDGFEVATRLASFLWGTLPDTRLLDLAAAGELDTSEQVRAVAQEMLADAKAFSQTKRFHTMWLGLDQLPHQPALSNAMRAETEALLKRVLLDEKRPWQDLLRSTETYVGREMATLYGLSTATDNLSWVPYGNSGRRGLLSHGSFLSYGAINGDTSPTQRGIAIRSRLFCQEIPPPPPTVNVNTDGITDSTSTVCKWDRYAMHRQGGCSACHVLTDGLGFGLERFDHEGKYREHDKGLPECRIAGDGEVADVGTFNGPAELGDVMISSGALTSCLITQVYRFAAGKTHLEDNDEDVVKVLRYKVGTQDFRLDDLFLDLVSSDAFRHVRFGS